MAKQAKRARVRGTRSKGGGLLAQIRAIVKSTLQDIGVAEPGKKRLSSDVRDALKTAGAPQVYKMLPGYGMSEEPPNRPPLTSVKQLTPDVKRALRTAGKPTTFMGGQVEKPYSNLTKNMGASILALGNNVPDDVHIAALDAVNGTNFGGHKSEAELKERLRDAKGVQQSGAKSLNKFTRGMRSKMQMLSQAGLLADMASRGGVAGAIAQTELTSIAIDKGTDLFEKKFVQRIFTKVAEKLYADPLAGERAFRMIGRGLRLGGAIGTAAMVGVNIAQEYFAQRQQSASAQMGIHRAAEASGIDAAISLATRKRIEKQTMDSRGVAARISDELGFDAATQSSIADRTKNQFSGIVSIRQNPALFGIDAAKIITNLARSKRVPIESLTEAEKQIALQAAISDAVDVPESSVEMEMKARGFYKQSKNKNMSNQILAFDAVDGGYADTGDDGGAEGTANALFLEGKRGEIRDEIKLKIIEGKLNDYSRKLTESQRQIAAMPKEQRQAIVIEVREARMSQTAFRNRHRVEQLD